MSHETNVSRVSYGLSGVAGARRKAVAADPWLMSSLRSASSLPMSSSLRSSASDERGAALAREILSLYTEAMGEPAGRGCEYGRRIVGPRR